MKALIAAFDAEERLRDAVNAATAASLSIREVYSPYELDLDLPNPRLDQDVRCVTRDCTLGAGLSFLLVFALEAWSKLFAFPLHVGAREALPWPALILPAIEAAMLAGGFCGLASFLVRARMPALADPIFDTPDFSVTGANQFYLVLSASQEGEAIVREAGATAIHGAAL